MNYKSFIIILLFISFIKNFKCFYFFNKVSINRIALHLNIENTRNLITIEDIIKPNIFIKKNNKLDLYSGFDNRTITDEIVSIDHIRELYIKKDLLDKIENNQITEIERLKMIKKYNDNEISKYQCIDIWKGLVFE